MRARPVFLCLLLGVGSVAGCRHLPECLTSHITSIEHSVFFYPAKYQNGDWDTHDPAIEDAWFEAADGVKLHGWFCEAANPRAVVLIAHGNAGNVTSYGEHLRMLRDRFRVSALAFDYRGYGRSKGTPSEAGILADARAARRWLAQRTGARETDIVLMGYSLGGGVMVNLAAREGARGLVLESTFTSLPDVAAHHAPLLPTHLLMTMRLDSLALIRDYHGPLLQAHGDTDSVIPFALGKKLFDAANEPKQFLHIRGGGHNDPPAPVFLQALEQFFEQLQPLQTDHRFSCQHCSED